MFLLLVSSIIYHHNNNNNNSNDNNYFIIIVIIYYYIYIIIINSCNNCKYCYCYCYKKVLCALPRDPALIRLSILSIIDKIERQGVLVITGRGFTVFSMNGRGSVCDKIFTPEQDDTDRVAGCFRRFRPRCCSDF
jgi:hypothetical protein